MAAGIDLCTKLTFLYIYYYIMLFIFLLFKHIYIIFKGEEITNNNQVITVI